MAELEHATRGGHIFVAGSSRDRGFVEVEFDRNVPQPEWLHCNVAIIEEILLASDDGFGDSKNRGESLFGIAYEPSSFLKLLPKLRMAGVAGSPEDFRIAPVDSDGRENGRINGRHPLQTMMPDDYIGHHIAGVSFGKSGTGAWVQAANLGVGRT